MKLWFSIALALNIALQLLALAMLPMMVESLLHTCLAVGSLVVLLLVRAYDKQKIYPWHAGAMIILMISGMLVMRGSWPWWADLVLHFCGGLLVAVYLLILFGDHVPSGWFTFLFGLGMVALVGVSWELLEGLAAQFSPNLDFVLVGTDILSDLLADLLGGALGTLLFLRR